MAKKDWVDTGVDATAKRMKYPYDEGRTNFRKEMRRYKDTPGDTHSDGTQDGSLGDGSETQLGKGAYHENRVAVARELAKKGDYAGLSKAGHDNVKYAKDSYGRGAGYASENAHRIGKASIKKAAEMGTVARKRMVANWNKDTGKK